LGFASLQITALTSNRIALDRSQASIMAYDIIDAMRSNRTEAMAGKYNLTSGSSAPTGTAVSSQDLRQWLVQLSSRLPSGQGSITVSASTGVVNVNVIWDDSKGANLKKTVSINSRL